MTYGSYKMMCYPARWLRSRRARRYLPLLLLTALAAGAFWRSLPEPLFDRPLSTVLVGRDGTLLGARIAEDEQWRFPPLERVPEKFKAALIAYEDKRFFSHPGVDPLALARAIRLNIGRGKVVSGGSTISMQVIRLSLSNPPRTYLEKLKEMLLALRLEFAFEKEEILALWAGNAPFGGNVVGLEAAAWRYFGCGPDRLSWAEACLLAVLPNSPALVHPGRNRDSLRQARDRLLERLRGVGVLSELELRLALLEPLPGEPRPMPRLGPHLLETLRAEHGTGRYVSTVDAVLQRRAVEVVERHGRDLTRQGIGNIAAIVVDNRTFEVLAYVGNSAPGNDPEQGAAIDLIRRPRSTGSILKPLLYAAMLQEGEILPTTLVPDIPTRYNGYTPENFDRSFRGAVPARDALARSLNVPAVRMLRAYGVERFAHYLKNMGMTTLHRPPEEYGLTLILGGAEGMLWDLAGMYANLAALARDPHPREGGAYRRLSLLLGESTGTGRRADLGQGAAWLTLEALLEVTRPGAEDFWKNFSSSRKIAWKTGTSYGLRDGWAIGSTPRYTVGVWTGNASGEGVAGLTGLGAAAPVLFDLFGLLDSADWFPVPYGDLKEVEACRDDGYLANGRCEAERLLVPRDSHFDQVTPYHRVVHLDADRSRRVHDRCETVAEMVRANWFVLPPAMEYFYRKRHPGYRSLPPFRGDCREAAAEGAAGPIELLYPMAGTRLYIPVDLDGRFSRTVFEAVHRQPDTTLYWHLDDEFLGTTRTFHQQAVLVGPGRHRVILVDETGNRLERHFEVLSKEGEES